MRKNEPLPKIRTDIQIIPVQIKNETVYVIQDHLGLAPSGSALRHDTLKLLYLISQSSTFSDFQYQLTKLQGGEIVDEDIIDKIILDLDNLNLLETSNFHSGRKRIVRDYTELRVRDPVMAGKGYPEKSTESINLVNKIITGISKPQTQDFLKDKQIKAIIAPHIDLTVGSQGYGFAYTCWPDKPPRRIILLGTGHAINNGFYSITDKDFITPMGLLKNDKDTVKRLRSAVSGALAPNDFAHRSEHSLEFQTLFIRHLIGESDTRIVPILCGSFMNLLSMVEKPSDYLQIAGFLAALSEIASESDTMIVAGIDLSHIGPKFGHTQSASSLSHESKIHDGNLLEALKNGNVRDLWKESQRVADRYNVCGLSTMATLLEITNSLNLEGQILHYEMWHEKATRSAVSFASAVFWTR
ncbi:AmmeMemoRadiSam system protein B [bacterium]|nr:AmmeMemoRadiSam system protein B [candidate division CSSED10-310 bacterium]